MSLPQAFERKAGVKRLRLRASAVALLYLVVGGLWIWLSDHFVARLTADAAQIAAWQTYKGWVFVVLSALLLWGERAWSDRRVHEVEQQLRERMQERTTELERVRSQLQIILDNAPIAFSMRGVDNTYIIVNRHWEEVAGYPRDQVVGKTPYDVFPKAVADELTEALDRLWEKRSGLIEEFSMTVRGQERVFMRASFPLFDEEGNPYAGAALITDISERKAVEESLRQAEARFRAVFHTVGVGINIVSPSGHYVGANPAFQKMLGYTEAELVGKHFREVTYPPDLIEDERITKEIEARPYETAEEEKRYVRADGSLVWARLLISAIRNSDGTLANYVTVVEEITARKEAEAQQQRIQAELARLVAERTAELQHLNQQLEARVAERTAHLQQEIAERVRAEAAIKELNATLAEQAEHLVAANKELETFTYSVSHDLKAPLRGIDGYSRLLLEDYADRLDEEGRYFLQTIRNATTQMAQLIDDLLSYSRLERRTLAVSQVDVAKVVVSVLSQMQAAQVYPQTTIDVQVEPAIVNTDVDALALVLRNLIDNALKFSANGAAPRVAIRGESCTHLSVPPPTVINDKVNAVDDNVNKAHPQDEAHKSLPKCYRLSVRDNGVGFDMQYQDRIFEIFQRLHRSEEYPGTGVGLAMVRKALQRMGGRVWVESQPGQGATFTMEIPTI